MTWNTFNKQTADSITNTTKLLSVIVEKSKLIDLLIDAIDHSYFQTDGTYGDLSKEVSDKVEYIKKLKCKNKLDIMENTSGNLTDEEIDKLVEPLVDEISKAVEKRVMEEVKKEIKFEGDVDFSNVDVDKIKCNREQVLVEQCWLVEEIESAVARNADYLQVKYKVNGVICKRTINIDKWRRNNIPRRCEIVAEALNIKNFEGFVKDEDSIELIYKDQESQEFDTEEIKNLDDTIVNFILPRLKEFRELRASTPIEFEEDNSNIKKSRFAMDFNSMEDWLESLDYMIDYFEKYEKYKDSKSDSWKAMTNTTFQTFEECFSRLNIK